MTLQRLFGQGLDRLVLEGMIGLVRRGDYVVARQEGEELLTECGLGDPGRFFPALPAELAQEVERRLLEQHPHYTVSQWRVPSPIAAAAPPNDVIGVRRFTPRRGLRGRVIILHGAMMSTYFLWNWLGSRLAQRGIEALVPSMPDHYERTPPGEVSGQYLIGGHLQRGLEVIRQGVTDVRALVRRLRRADDAPLGIVGFSMGGLIGGWTITLEALDFAVLVEPAVQLDPIVFETRLGDVVRHSLGQAGWSEEEAREWLRALSPLWSPPLLPPERLLLVLPEHDGFVPPHAVERAWECWGQPQLARYPAGHISIYLLRHPWQDIFAFVQRWCPPAEAPMARKPQREVDKSTV